MLVTPVLKFAGSPLFATFSSVFCPTRHFICALLVWEAAVRLPRLLMGFLSTVGITYFSFNLYLSATFRFLCTRVHDFTVTGLISFLPLKQVSLGLQHPSGFDHCYGCDGTFPPHRTYLSHEHVSWRCARLAEDGLLTDLDYGLIISFEQVP